MQHRIFDLEQSQKYKEFRVFVAGMPSSLKLRYVKEYFSLIGRITRVEPVNPKQREEPAIKSSDLLEQCCRKGCCVISTDCQDTFNKLVGGANFRMLGRQIICKRYLESDELAAQNQKINQQRLLLKRVPSHVSEELLLQFLSACYGPVQVLYPFKTQKLQGGSLLEKTVKTFQTYSVTFEDQTLSHRLAEAGQILGPQNCTITVQQYKYFSKAEKSKMLEHRQNRVRDSPTAQAVSPLRTASPGRLGPTEQTDYSRLSRPIALSSNKYPSKNPLGESWKSPTSPSSINAASNHRKPHLEPDTVKPTRKRYFLQKAKQIGYWQLSTRSNLRMNLSTHRLSTITPIDKPLRIN